MDPLTIILIVVLVLILAGWQGVYTAPGYVTPGAVLVVLLVIVLVLFLTGHGFRRLGC
jgi:hypothetical protein